MKKLVGLVLISILLLGCTVEQRVEYESETINLTRKGSSSGYFFEIEKFEYKGHKYLKFGNYSIVHDPDCPCHNRTQQEIRIKSVLDDNKQETQIEKKKTVVEDYDYNENNDYLNW